MQSSNLALMEYPKISVIVPVYNAKKHLNRCIDSILSQSFQDFEIILIDDGSTDDSGQICDEYSVSCDRISCIHKSNGGVSSARNAGLSKSKGEYITFIDGDDLVYPHYLSNLCSHMRDEIDLVFSYAVLDYGGTPKKEDHAEMVIEKESLHLFLEQEKIKRHTGPWAKLFRSSLIKQEGLLFPERLPIGEDAVFLFNYLAFCRKIWFTNDHDYEYFVNSPNSLTKKLYSPSRELEIFKIIENAVFDLISSCSVSSTVAKDSLNDLLYGYVIRILDSLYFSDNNDVGTRIQVIKSLPGYLISSNHYTGAFRSDILAFLLKNRMLYVYDFVRIVAQKIRNIKKK